MNIKSLLLAAIPVIIALVVYDMFLKGALAGILNKYDDTFEREETESNSQIDRELLNYSRRVAA